MNKELFGKEGLTLLQYVWKRAEKDEFFRWEIIGEYLDLLEEKDGCKMIIKTMEDWEE
tara:strand:+ start:52 stop:225 length:174 start_codon:yes stop_codon:yes gene_type:complete